MSGHGFSQFELTQKLLQNLNNFKLTPTAKLVLMYLSSCYNPKHGEMFPKQRTIADKLGISEASVIRAICELHKEGLIISERKYTNRYVFTSKFLFSLGILDNNMQAENSQNEIKETLKMQPPLIEPKSKTNKQPISVEDYKILKAHAQKFANKSVEGYINRLRQVGADKEIIEEYKQAQRKAQRMKEAVKKNIEDLEFARQNRAVVDENYWKEIRNKIQNGQ